MRVLYDLGSLPENLINISKAIPFPKKKHSVKQSPKLVNIIQHPMTKFQGPTVMDSQGLLSSAGIMAVARLDREWPKNESLVVLSCSRTLRVTCICISRIAGIILINNYFLFIYIYLPSIGVCCHHSQTRSGLCLL